MKNTVNPRIPVLLCVCLAAGIYAGCAAMRHGVDWLYFLLPLIIIAAAAVVIAAARKRGVKPVIVAVLSCVMFITGIAYGSFVFELRDVAAPQEGESYVTGTVENLVIGDETRQITLKDVTLNGAELYGKMLVTISETGGELCDEGDTVYFYAEVEKYDVITYGNVNSHVVEGVLYQCTVYYGLEADGGFSFFGGIRSFVRDMLYDNLDKSTAGVAYAMLTGNDGGAEEGLLSSFRYGGIAHIFAVSGLHIGVVYGALTALRKLLRRRGVVSSIVCVAAVALYSGVCGFTVSSVRAVIMCAVSAVCRHSGKKYDTLNSLSFAVIIILLVNPLDLFSAGFRLSVLAVAGIALYIAAFKKLFRFMPFNAGEGIAVTFSAQIGTIPAMFSSFGYVSAAGLILNIVVVPLLSVVFVLLLCGIFLSAVIPAISGAVIGFCALPLEGIMSLIALGGFEQAAIYGFGGRFFVIAYYVFAVALSDKINKSKLQRIALSALAVFAAVCYALAAAYYPVNGTMIAISAYYGGGYALFKNSQGGVLVISEGVSTYKLNIFLSSCGESDCRALVILGGETCSEFVYSLGISAERAYICGGYLAVNSDDATKIVASDSFVECGIEFTFLDGYTVTAVCGGVKTGICAGECIPEDCDLLAGDLDFSDYAGAYSVNFSSGGGDCCVYTDGGKTFTARGALKPCLLF